MLIIEATHPDDGSITVLIKDGDVEIEGGVSDFLENQLTSIGNYQRKTGETTEQKQPDGTTEEVVIEETVEASDEDKCNRAIDDLEIKGYDINDVYEKDEDEMEDDNQREVTPPSIDDISDNN